MQAEEAARNEAEQRRKAAEAEAAAERAKAAESKAKADAELEEQRQREMEALQAEATDLAGPQVCRSVSCTTFCVNRGSLVMLLAACVDSRLMLLGRR